MSIKCGRCGNYHETVAAVRECYNGGTPAAETPTVSTAKALSVPQVNMVNVLLGKLGLIWTSDTPLSQLPRWGTGRILIDDLKAAEQLQAHGRPFTPPLGTAIDPRPKPAGSRERGLQPKLPDVPAGHYAIPSLTGNNDLDFFRVDRPEEGTWAGRTFVHRVIGGKPDSRVRGTTARQALEAIIAAGPDKARQLYGQEIGRCWRCNRHLTDETSRYWGIGPDCAGQVGCPYTPPPEGWAEHVQAWEQEMWDKQEADSRKEGVQ
jgi:Family of unknown function (DUF6011)